MSISDELMFKYYLLLSEKTLEEIEKMKQDIKSGDMHPMDAKKQLAFEIVNRYYGVEIAKNAKDYFEQLFSKREIPEDLQEVTYDSMTKLIEIITSLNFSSSNSEARRLANQGAVTLNGEKVTDLNNTLEIGEYILKVGKRKIAKINVK